MGKINDIAKRFAAEAEEAKKADFESKYGQHYNSVMLPHIRQLDETFSKTVNELKQQLEADKSAYITTQRSNIESQVNAEYTAFFSAIASFLEENNNNGV